MQVGTGTPSAGFGHDLWVRIKNIGKGKANSAVNKAESEHVAEQLDLATEQEKGAKGKFDAGALSVVEAKKLLEAQRTAAIKAQGEAQTRAATAATEAVKAKAAGDMTRYNQMLAQGQAQSGIAQSQGALVANLDTQITGLQSKENNMVAGSIKLGAQIQQHRAEAEVVKAQNAAADGQLAAQDATMEAGSAADSAAAIRQRAMDNVTKKQARVDAREEFAGQTGTSDLDSIAATNAANDSFAALLAQAEAQHAPAVATPAANPNGTLTMF